MLLIKNVVATVIYARNNSSAYIDPECTTPFPNEELYEAAIKGAVVHYMDTDDGELVCHAIGVKRDTEGVTFVMVLSPEGGTMFLSGVDM